MRCVPSVVRCVPSASLPSTACTSGQSRAGFSKVGCLASCRYLGGASCPVIGRRGQSPADGPAAFVLTGNLGDIITVGPSVVAFWDRWRCWRVLVQATARDANVYGYRRCPLFLCQRDANLADGMRVPAPRPLPLRRLPCPHRRPRPRGSRPNARADASASRSARTRPPSWDAWPTAWPVSDPSTWRSSVTNLLPCSREGKEFSWSQSAVQTDAACH